MLPKGPTGTNPAFREKIDEYLKSKDFDALMSSGVTQLYKKGEIIFKEGGLPTGIYFVKFGWVKKYRTTPKGDEQIFCISGKGELLGYYSLVGDQFYMVSARTLSNSEITFIPKETFLKMLKNSPTFSNLLLKGLGREFSSFVNIVTSNQAKSARERVAFHILVLDEKFRSADAENKPEIRLSRADLASLVATSKETLVRILQEYKRFGLIDKTEKSVWVTDRTGLIREVNGSTKNNSKKTRNELGW